MPTPPTTIGLVGVGLVGTAIARRFNAAGHTVIGYDPVPPAADLVTPATSAAEVFATTTTVFLSLPTSDIVSGVLADAHPHLTADHLIIDTTTGDPETADAHLAGLDGTGAAYIEATVAGSSDLLDKRQAPLFVGGEPPHVDRARPQLDVLADQVHHLGPPGAASRFKLVFNLVLGLHRAVLAEALHFGESLGFDPAATLDVLQNSPAGSGVMATKGQKMLDRTYTPPQARLSQHLKDVRLMLTEAQRNGKTLPLTTTHLALLEKAEHQGFGKSDTAAVREAF